MMSRTAIHPLKIVAALAAFVAAMAVVLTYTASPARAAGDCSTTAGITTCTFSPTGAEDTFLVPDEVSSVHIVATGAPGAAGYFGGSGGRGAKVESGDLTVTAGDTLYVNVGGAPTSGGCELGVSCNGGFNGGGAGHFGGGGGGASDVRTVSRVEAGSLSSRLIVAGGGGGGSIGTSCGLNNLPGSAGGDAGSDGSDGIGCDSTPGGGGGKAGSQSAGGLGGSPGGQNGSLGLGGDGGRRADLPNFGSFGGGGGGGLYGGGGGGGPVWAGGSSYGAAGGGGGGSNLVPAGGSATIASDSPSVTISYATPHTVVVDRTDDPDLSTTPSAGACTVAADNDCSLRGAIEAANAKAGDDTIDLLGVSGTVNLTGALPDLSGNLEIEGPGADQLTVRRNTGGNYRIFSVGRDRVVSISGINIANGNVPGSIGGGIFNGGGTLTITNSTISGNSTSSSGGGVFNNDGATVIEHSTITKNTAPSGGGSGVASFGDDLTRT